MAYFFKWTRPGSVSASCFDVFSLSTSQTSFCSLARLPPVLAGGSTCPPSLPSPSSPLPAGHRRSATTCCPDRPRALWVGLAPGRLCGAADQRKAQKPNYAVRPASLWNTFSCTKTLKNVRTGQWNSSRNCCVQIKRIKEFTSV